MECVKYASLSWYCCSGIWWQLIGIFHRLIRGQVLKAMMELYMGLSENRVYSQWNSQLIGIMISKTIGFRGTQHFQTHPYFYIDMIVFKWVFDEYWWIVYWVVVDIIGGLLVG